MHRNLESMIEEKIAEGVLKAKAGSARAPRVRQKVDGCAKQYRSSKSCECYLSPPPHTHTPHHPPPTTDTILRTTLTYCSLGYLLSKITKRRRVVIDRMIEASGHGKDKADGGGAVFKGWCRKRMAMSNAFQRKNLIKAAQVVNGAKVREHGLGVAAGAGRAGKPGQEGAMQPPPADSGFGERTALPPSSPHRVALPVRLRMLPERRDS